MRYSVKRCDLYLVFNFRKCGSREAIQLIFTGWFFLIHQQNKAKRN